ncbi:MAG: hypothetical protein J6334_02715, partial [Kiritimatiellae bacterium]|nr:hypothetical protein [Kiritimatiellia bacterium]
HVSLTADSIFLVDTKGLIEIADSEISRGLDDVMNIHGNSTILRKVDGPRAEIGIPRFNYTGYFPYRVGEEVAFSRGNGPGKQILGRAVITEFPTPGRDAEQATIVFDRDIPAEWVGCDIANVSHTPTIWIHDNYFHDFLNIRLSALADIVYERNHLRNGNDAIYHDDLTGYWGECGPARTLVARDNVCEDMRGAAFNFAVPFTDHALLENNTFSGTVPYSFGAGVAETVEIRKAGTATFTSTACTIYDAGKALRQNCESGTYANPYTDENGGIWSYHIASADAPFTVRNGYSAHATRGDGQLDGWHNADPDYYPIIMVNMTGERTSMVAAGLGSDGNTIEADEMVFHPAASDSAYAVLRFTVPEDGWYSAFASFHDLEQLGQDASAGVDVHVTLGSEGGDTELATMLVTQENSGSWAASLPRTQRFDYQMPVRYLTQGMRLQFAVGSNGSHPGDGTGVKILVFKEKEGRFYDSGDAFAANIAANVENPYGTARHGMWHCQVLNLDAAATEIDFPSWVPPNLEYALSHTLTEHLTFNDGLISGFKGTTDSSQPFVAANVSEGICAGVSPRELYLHTPPHGWNQCTVVRFRPPEGGRYSGSVVVRDVGVENTGDDGVEVFLAVADRIVTNAVIVAERHEKATAHLMFNDRLLAAGEPVDIIVSPRSAYYNDETAVSAIFRREDGEVYDANASYYAHHAAGNTDIPFPDLLGGGAQWTLGTKATAANDATFAPLAFFWFSPCAALGWWTHSWNAEGSIPRISMMTNAVASCDGSNWYLTGDPKLSIAPNEFYVHPNVTGQANSCATVRAIVPADGIYRMHGRVRDLEGASWTDGVRFCLAVGGCVPATGTVSIDGRRDDGCNAETSFEGDRLWLRAGETLDTAVDPLNNYACDTTGLGVCYEREAVGAVRVVNVDFTGDGNGKLSANTMHGREGYGDWRAWNALRPGSGAGAECVNCCEADGVTPRNMTVSLAHASGAIIATGSSSTGYVLCDSFIFSSDPEDTYTFTIANLKANNRYTLYLYSAIGTGPGNASFTIDGVTKGVEEIWALGETKMLTRFEVMSDENGEIRGTFAAADGHGGAFNGITLVGEFPDFIPDGTTAIFK